MRRLNAYARMLAEKLEWEREQLEALEFGAILHDIGKIYIPETILQKEGKLTKEEMADIRKHPEVGAHMIKDIPYLAPSAPMVLHHHERWDGEGYPEGLSGEEIPVGARVLAVADAFDAMTSNRPYRSALPAEVAYQEILNCSGTQFDPQIVEAMKTCWESGEIQEILDQNNGHK